MVFQKQIFRIVNVLDGRFFSTFLYNRREKWYTRDKRNHDELVKFVAKEKKKQVQKKETKATERKIQREEAQKLFMDEFKSTEEKHEGTHTTEKDLRSQRHTAWHTKQHTEWHT